MKSSIKNIIKGVGVLSVIGLVMTSCHNQNFEFDDYDYSAAYFSYQYPVRTLVLGEDILDNSLDNEHKLEIYATMGGVYNNDKKVTLDITVDETLCDGLFVDEAKTEALNPMPTAYYELLSDKIILDKRMQGGVQVQLKDAFFDDPKSIKNSYAIPVLITSAHNVDSVLVGSKNPAVTSPVRTTPTDWDVLPKDYVLYVVKYINPYDAIYLRRGKDVITEAGVQSDTTRRKEYVESDDIITLTTAAKNVVTMPLTINYGAKLTADCELDLTFDNNGNCTVASATPNFTVTGTGKFVSKGEKDSWGNKDRSAIYLDYNVKYNGQVEYATLDTLVVRNRNVKMEILTPYK